MGMSVNLDDGSASGGDDGGNEQIVAEINITPLTDVFLVLLIIFMVTSTALIDSEKAAREGVKVALPKANASASDKQRKHDPIVTVDKQNQIFVFNKKVDAANLGEELKKAMADVGSTTVLLRGDTNVLLGSAVNIMSVAKKAGATSIAILTAPEGGK